MKGAILIVDDQRSMCEMLETALSMRGFQATTCTSAEEALGRLRDADFDAVLTDVRMPGISGLQLCGQLRDTRPDIPVVVMTAFGSLETAVSAIRAGAYDFITKPVEIDLLAIALERAVNNRQLREQVRRLNEQVSQAGRFGDIIGESPRMTDLYDQVARVADSESSILVTGESGTGKELVARMIHRRSRRADKPFVAVNCAALPESLLESELFGHAKGAFTDARSERKGLFLEADSGTMLLDEIGDMPLVMQAKLLRALEEGKLRPVGGSQEIPFDVRVLAATNRDLLSAIEEGRFREDLFYRINVIQLELPPLRARGTDVLLLARHFVGQFATRSGKPVTGLADNAAERLLAYSWPGNVRELRNVIERAVALTRFEKISLEDLPDNVRNFQSTQFLIDGQDPAALASLEEVERRYILHVLETVDHNKSLAARVLGLDRKTLYRKLKQYGASEG